MSGRPVATMLALLLAIVAMLAMLAESARGETGRQRQAQQVVNAITREFGAGPLGACFWRIASRESGLNPRAVNLTDHHADGSTGSFGALMIGALWRRPGETVDHFRARMMDPLANAREARRLYDRFGLQPWGGTCR